MTDDRIARIPPIGGLDAVPLLNPEDEASNHGHKIASPFIVQLGNVVANYIREVWIDSFRLTTFGVRRRGFEESSRSGAKRRRADFSSSRASRLQGSRSKECARA